MKLITCILLVHMGNNDENGVIPQNAPSHHLKYYLWLKTKEDVKLGRQLWEVIRQNTVNKGIVATQI